MGSHGLVVARIRPGSEPAVADVFTRSDATELPRLGRVRHRSLFSMPDGLYLHLIQTDGDFGESIRPIIAHPLFKAVSADLAPYITPYDPETWRSPRDAFASEFYSWDRPDGP